VKRSFPADRRQRLQRSRQSRPRQARHAIDQRYATFTGCKIADHIRVVEITRNDAPAPFAEVLRYRCADAGGGASYDVASFHGSLPAQSVNNCLPTAAG
jgi:hypothetical protein